MDDYPTDEQLQDILDFKGSPRQFIEYINSIWWSDGFKVKQAMDDSAKVKRCSLSTWGWSGNEDIVAVMKQTWFWMLYWRESRRGGHYVFEVPNDGFLKSLTSVIGLSSYGMPHSKVNEDDPANVNRFEVIDHRECVWCRGRKLENRLVNGDYKEMPCSKCEGSGLMGGRVYSVSSNPERSIIKVELSYQDEGKTLKVFINDAPAPS